VSALRGPKGGGLAGLSKSMDGVVQQLDERVVEDREARPVKLIPAEATMTERIEGHLDASAGAVGQGADRAWCW